MLEVVIIRKRSCWLWRVCDQAGRVLVHGRETSRAEARYRAERTLFQLLLISGSRLTGRSAAGR